MLPNAIREQYAHISAQKMAFVFMLCIYDVKITVLPPEIESKKENIQKNDTWKLVTLSKLTLTFIPIFKWNQPHL